MILFTRLFPKYLLKSYIDIFYFYVDNNKQKSIIEIIILFVVAPLCCLLFSLFCFSKQDIIILRINDLILSLAIITIFTLSSVINLRIKYKILDKLNKDIQIYNKEIITLAGMGVLFSICSIIAVFIASFINFLLVQKILYAIVYYCSIMIFHSLFILINRLYRDF